MAKKRKFTTIRVTIDGEKFHKSVAYRTALELAEKKQQFLEELKNKNAPKIFETVADEWEEEHSKTIEFYTQSCYVAPLKNLKAEFGGRTLESITAIDFQRFLDRMAAEGYAKQTIKLRRIVMSQIFDYAIFQGYIQHNPIKVCKVSKKAKQTSRSLPNETDIDKIKKKTDTFFGRYCTLLMLTGMRREEALALTYEDLDFENNIISVNKVLVFENGKGVIRETTKTKAGNRVVPFLPALQELFKEHKNGLIFTFDSEPLKKYQFDKGFKKFKSETGLTCSSHQLRHYFATVCFDAGLDEKDTQEIIGHSKISTTKDIYIHIRKQRKDEAFNKLNLFIQNNIN